MKNNKLKNKDEVLNQLFCGPTKELEGCYLIEALLNEFSDELEDKIQELKNDNSNEAESYLAELIILKDCAWGYLEKYNGNDVTVAMKKIIQSR